MSERPRRAGRRFLRSGGGKRPPTVVGQPGMVHDHRIAEMIPHPPDQLGGQRDLGQHVQHVAARTQFFGDQPDVYLGLAAARHPRAATRRPFRRTARRSARNNVAAPGSVRAGGTGPRRLPCRRPPDGRTGAGTYPSKPSVRPKKPSANDAARISGRRNRAGRSAPDTRSSPGTAPGPSTANRERHANPPRCGPTDAARRKSPAGASSFRRPPPEPKALRT